MSDVEKIGSVMIVGGGIAGMQAALDLADSGFYVYLVEKSGAIGGTMAQLDKTFPTDDCLMGCIAPKLVECGRQPNIQILTESEVTDISGVAGNFAVTLCMAPRHVDTSTCVVCGPCEEVCPAEAINLNDIGKILRIDVGAVILATGFEFFDPKFSGVWGYGTNANILTSLQFERYLSSSGTTRQCFKRPLDGKRVRKIAFLQCVGSRDESIRGNSYCSSVCCMTAIKQAVTAKDSIANLTTSIFYMDMRTHGKSFEQFMEHAKDEAGVLFVRCRMGEVTTEGKSGDLRLRYVNEDGQQIEEIFDMVVLAVGLQTPKNVLDLARLADIRLTVGNFVATSDFAPVKTSREGIFACGVLAGPKDIPPSVVEGSAAAAAVAELLTPARNKMTVVAKYPEERDITNKAKVTLYDPLQSTIVPIIQKCMVIGGGVTGMTAALNLAQQGFTVHLVERTDTLGGNGLNLKYTWTGEHVQVQVAKLIEQVICHERILIHKERTVSQVTGFVGNFHSTLTGKNGKTIFVEHGAGIVATGGVAAIPKEFNYGSITGVVTSVHFDKLFEQKEKHVKQAKRFVFIQCVGSREKDHMYCSKVCCTHSVQSAISLKKENPERSVYILYRDMRTYALRESLYKEARKLGVIFINYKLHNKPKVTGRGAEIDVAVWDHILQQPLVIAADMVILAVAIRPREDAVKFGTICRIPVDDQGFFQEADARLRPVDCATDGIFVAGLAHYPKPMEESIAQALAAAARVATILSKREMRLDTVKAVVDDTACDGDALYVDA